MVRFSKIVLIFFISLFYTNISLGKSPPPGTGTANIPANIMIMLDNSASMSSQLYSSLEIYTPIDVATDSQKNIYVLEYAYNRISVFNQSGKLLRNSEVMEMLVINGNMQDKSIFTTIYYMLLITMAKVSKSFP